VTQNMTPARRLAWIVVILFALTGIMVTAAACHKKVPQQAAAPPPPPPPPPPPAAPPPPPPPPPPAAPPPTPAAAPAPLTEDQIFAQKSLDQLNAEKPMSDVFFDLDQSEIREGDRAALQRDADWMKRWATTIVTVEGHGDSRGSSEYNLALGNRRATGVRDYLVNLGVPAGRLTVISKGKEQPFCTEENEACWQQNRRGHFIVTAK
jgi:peptidoglycan-associated lipoprotein